MAEQEINDPVPLTPVQRWYFSRAGDGGTSHLNLSVLVETPPLAPAPLAAALAFLARRHDSLRLRFRRRPEGWVQWLEAPDATTPPGLLVLDLSALPQERMSGAVSAVASEVQASLDLTRGPVQRTVLFNLGAQRSGRLLWVVHHLVTDGVSWQVLLTDLVTAYGHIASGAPGPVKLPPTTISYKRWAEILREHAASPELAAELPFWRDQPWGAVAPLPRDIPSSGATIQGSERSVILELDQEETRALLSEVPKLYQTKIREVVLSAVARTFAAWTASPVLLVDVEMVGRANILPGVDLSRTVGWFTTFNPVVLDLSSVADPGSALKSVKEQLQRMPIAGRVSVDLLGDRLPPLPVPELGFNYIGNLDAAQADLGGLRLAREASGPQRSPHLLRLHLIELEIAVKDGKLVVTCFYSEDAHRRSTIERLLEGVGQALRELIAHSRQPGAGG